MVAVFLCRSAYDTVVPAMGRTIVKTDLAIAVPDGTYGRIGGFVSPSPSACVSVLRSHPYSTQTN